MLPLKKFLLRHELLIMILCLVAILRLPSLLEPYWYGDEGIYLTLGTGIRHGLTLYRDIHDNKPPIIYLLAALSGSLFWFRFLLLVWNTLSIAVFSWIATQILNPKRLHPSKLIAGISFPVPTLATLATLIFALAPFTVEGNIANGEIFMILPTLIGMALLFKRRSMPQQATQKKIALTVLSGIAFSMAFLIKVPALFDAVLAGFYFFLIPTKAVFALKARLKLLRQNLFSLSPWVFGIAFFAPILLSILYFVLVGAGKPYIQAALLQNVGYLGSWSTGSQAATSVGSSGLKVRALILAVASLLTLLVSPLIMTESVFVSLWLGFALFGALLSERPYPHYLIQILAPLALVLPIILKLIFGVLKKRLPRLETIRHIGGIVLLITSAGVVVASILIVKFWRYPILPYYQNYVSFVTGKISRDQYFSYFDPTLPEQYRLAKLIFQSTTPTDRIFLWGDLPDIYALTHRLPPGRYTSAYHIKDFNGYQETLLAIYNQNPKIILIDRRIEMFPKLAPLLGDEYLMIYSSPIFQLYSRKI